MYRLVWFPLANVAKTCGYNKLGRYDRTLDGRIIGTGEPVSEHD